MLTPLEFWQTVWEWAGVVGISDTSALTLRKLFYMYRAKRMHDMELSAGISRVIAEVNRDPKENSTPYRTEKFHAWIIPEFVHEAMLKPPTPTMSVAALKAEYEAWQSQYR